MPTTIHNFLAIDLGASNGRVIRARLCDGRLELRPVHRFAHHPVRSGGKLRWQWKRILTEVNLGLALAAESCGREKIASVSCSSWAQDFGLVDGSGRLLFTPVCYRDRRTAGMPQSFGDIISANQLVRRVGSGALPITTLCQLRAMAVHEPRLLSRAARLLFFADLIHYELCGAQTTDWTLATASQLCNVRHKAWDNELASRLDIPSEILPALRKRPQIIGHIPASNSIHPRLAGVSVVSGAGHDTAAAAAGLNSWKRHTLFLSLGTWAMFGFRASGLQGVRAPAKHHLALLGLVGGKWGIFRAETGLWIIQQCFRQWQHQGLNMSYQQLVAEAESVAPQTTFNPADTRFEAPRNMLAEVCAACREAGGPAPHTPGEVARAVFDSMAAHYAMTVTQLAKAVGEKTCRIRLVGGGSQNGYLCRQLGRLAGVPVQTGPAEATVWGNVVAQCLALDVPQIPCHS